MSAAAAVMTYGDVVRARTFCSTRIHVYQTNKSITPRVNKYGARKSCVFTDAIPFQVTYCAKICA